MKDMLAGCPFSTAWKCSSNVSYAQDTSGNQFNNAKNFDNIGKTKALVRIVFAKETELMESTPYKIKAHRTQ